MVSHTIPVDFRSNVDGKWIQIGLSREHANARKVLF